MIDLQQFDLVPYHLAASVVGLFCSLWLIKLSTHDRVGAGEKLCFRWVSRLAYALIGVSMGWCASFGLEQGWQPWPPVLLMIVAVDLRMISSIAAAYFKNRQHAVAR
jgi:hypothetical protein